tara:strand:+ start:9854 stop:10054 length:201 start_codon:yes stop_codon:yes gene_type:complete
MTSDNIVNIIQRVGTVSIVIVAEGDDAFRAKRFMRNFYLIWMDSHCDILFLDIFKEGESHLLLTES